jgi:hypothetical protein
MKSQSLTLALVLSAALLPGIAQASPKSSAKSSIRLAQGLTQQQVSAPEIDNFTVNSVAQLTPGTELLFTLQGTPNSNATLTIGNLVTNIPMREVEPGVYQGRYTIRNQDQISENTVVRANLQRGDRFSSVRLQQPLTTNTASNSNTSTTNPSTGSNTGNQGNQSLRIDQFTMQPVQQLDPGTELTFTLVGTPNATATYSIEGVATNLPMQEVSSGTYRATYVIRRQDTFPANTNVVANLQANGQSVRAQLAQGLTANSSGNTNTTTQLPLEVTSPTNNSRVSGTVEVTGRSAPNATINVNVQATNSLAGIVGLNRTIVDRSIQTDAQGNFNFTFQPNISIPGTRYEVSLSAVNGEQTKKETLVLYQQ